MLPGTWKQKKRTGDKLYLKYINRISSSDQHGYVICKYLFDVSSGWTCAYKNHDEINKREWKSFYKNNDYFIHNVTHQKIISWRKFKLWKAQIYDIMPSQISKGNCVATKSRRQLKFASRSIGLRVKTQSERHNVNFRKIIVLFFSF